MLIPNILISALEFLQKKYLESLEAYRVHYDEKTMTITILPWAKPAALTLTFFIPISVMMSLSGGLTVFFLLLFFAGIPIAFLLWLWLTNLALLFGAELDSELERGRELQSGIAAEETLQLPPRDTRKIEKAEKKEAEDVRLGRSIRLGHSADRGTDDDHDKD